MTTQSTDELMQQLAGNCVCPYTACWSCAARDTIERLQRELAARDKTIEMLREKMREAYEVYAGSEGFIPETAPEGYQQRIIGQMAEILGEALAARSEGGKP